MGEVDRADNSACCEGCGSMRTTDSLKADGYISCCPERKMVPVREWRRRALDAELATRTPSEARRPALPDREAVELILRDTLTVGHGSTDGFAVTFVDGIQEAVEYICALSPAQAERDDMVLVPREPTEAMVEAGEEELTSRRDYGLRIFCADTYRAMLSAAPKEEPDHG